jgi:hypothetical protein
MMSIAIAYPLGPCYTPPPMAKRSLEDHQGTLNIRGIPKETIFRLKMAAAAEHRTVKGFILSLIEERIQELEKKGLLPKGK